MAIGQCIGCERPTKQFVKSGKFAKWCSKACRKIAYFRQPHVIARCAKRDKSRPRRRGKRVVSGICLGCDKPFSKVVDHGPAPSKYCSRRCSAKAHGIEHMVDGLAKSRLLTEPARLLRKMQRDARICAYLLRINHNRYKGKFPSCLQCKETFFRSAKSQVYCDVACRKAALRAARAEFRKSDTFKRCKRVDKARRRARLNHANVQSVDPFKVFDRDHWRCQLCRCSTPKTMRGTYNDRAPELDHIVPLSVGGSHTYENTQCACRRCNRLKGARPLGQIQMAV